MTTTPVPGHPFTTMANNPTDPFCVYTAPCRSGHTDCTVDCGWCKGTGEERPCNLPEGNARHRGAFVVTIEVHGNDRALVMSEAENAIELIELGDHGDDVWTETSWPPKSE